MSMMVDPRASDLIEALKTDEENFILSNLIFKNHRALKSVFAYFDLLNDLYEVAKDPKVGLEQLGPEPQKPSPEKLASMSERDKQQALSDYEAMVKIYNDMKRSMQMNIAYSDFMMIQNYMEKYRKTMHATPAVKGLRFKAFTKDVEHPEQSSFAKIFGRGGQQ